MTARLKAPNPLLIVRRMKKAATLIAVSLVLSAPLLAQESQFGILFGGSKRVTAKVSGTKAINDELSLGNSVREIFYAVPLDPITYFKIKAGKITAAGAFRIPKTQPSSGTRDVDVRDAEIQHVDGLVEYRFDEPFGSTGLFIGGGLYRQRGDVTEVVSGVQRVRSESETDYGLNGGVNGDFPLTRHLGVVLEGTYHWVHFATRPRYITLAAGLRVSF